MGHMRGDGFVLWEGPSAIDGTPIGVVVTHVTPRNRPLNRKIGNMSQAWILLRDTAPIDAVRNGADAAVCGSCRFRPSAEGGCYVPVAATAQRVWYTWRVRGSYSAVDRLPADLAEKPCRIGAWGDPAAVPAAAWEDLLQAVPSFTAYTHRWRELSSDVWGWCMASADSPAEAVDAQRAGWRTFRARLPSSPLLAGERVCPSAAEAQTHGKPAAVCAVCRLCDGVRLTPDGERQVRQPPSAAIIVHGHAGRRAERWMGGR